MIYEASPIAVVCFFVFVGVTLGLSFFLGRKAKSSAGYFAAHGQIPWFVNGVAFAGDYLSAASFLGICGMIAFYGYDGFLYSIGYLAGWIVALFVVAEPMKRLGKFTFADALDAKFQSKGIKLVAGISTLAVSVFYLIPQMVGAGVLVQPLLGFPHWVGVVLVGTTVILIVVMAGMVSTTWVQFLKGSLLVLFSAILTVLILVRGLTEEEGGADGHRFTTLGPLKQTDVDSETEAFESELAEVWGIAGAKVVPAEGAWANTSFVRIARANGDPDSVWHIDTRDDGVYLSETQTLHKATDGTVLVNGKPKGSSKGEPELFQVGHLSDLPGEATETGPLGPLEFFSTLEESEVVLWGNQKLSHEDGSTTTVYFQKPTSGSRILQPGTHPRFQGIHSDKLLDKINLLSLMLALFCGTASLPHILIRYYTVKDEASARKSTIVGIATIGFFYVLTLYMGLGAMTSGTLDVTNSNMSAPLLAYSEGEWLFAAISAIAFTTVLGTVSGLILASAGAVTHDLLGTAMGIQMTDEQQVRVAKIASVAVGIIAIVLGIVFQELNVSYLVGWAFSVAASANLPSLVMCLFWSRTTRQGVITSMAVGMTSSLAWILLSADTFEKVYGLDPELAIAPFTQPGIVTIPLGFLILVAVSLRTQATGLPGKDTAGLDKG
jgi:cation/acetate symporter